MYMYDKAFPCAANMGFQRRAQNAPHKGLIRVYRRPKRVVQGASKEASVTTPNRASVERHKRSSKKGYLLRILQHFTNPVGGL